MKKVKKIFLMLVISIILSGCSATYNLEFSSTGIKEELIINQEKVDLNEVKGIYIDSPVDYDVIVPDDDFSKIDKSIPLYEKDFINTSNGYQVKYSYNKHSDKSLANSNIVKNGFLNASSVIHNNTKQLSTSNGLIAFKAYPELTDVTINIKTDYNVLNNNADLVNGNVYTWYFSKDNNNKNIYLLMDIKQNDVTNKQEETVKNNQETKKEKESSIIVLFIFLGIFIIVMIFLFKFKKKV